MASAHGLPSPPLAVTWAVPSVRPRCSASAVNVTERPARNRPDVDHAHGRGAQRAAISLQRQRPGDLGGAALAARARGRTGRPGEGIEIHDRTREPGAIKQRLNDDGTLAELVPLAAELHKGRAQLVRGGQAHPDQAQLGLVRPTSPARQRKSETPLRAPLPIWPPERTLLLGIAAISCVRPLTPRSVRINDVAERRLRRDGVCLVQTDGEAADLAHPCVSADQPPASIQQRGHRLDQAV